MTRRKKNRVVVEITTNKPLTEKEAVQAMSLLLDRIDTDQKPIWANASNVYADKLTSKSFSRVVGSLPRQRRERKFFIF